VLTFGELLLVVTLGTTIGNLVAGAIFSLLPDD